MLTQQIAQFIAEKLPFDLKLLPSSACLVGGAVRDALLNRHRDYLDLDFVLTEKAVNIARQIAREYHRGFVVLDEERQIARVVFEEGTVDFAQQEGESLEIDLKRRDFTVNAIAYNPHQQRLIDPLQGWQDLEKGILRMISPQNLAEDPLRLLRAYRQAAQLHFTIDPETRLTIATLAPFITKVAAERVQSELNYLLKNPDGIPWLKAAWQDQLLLPWLPNITETSLKSLEKIDPIYQKWSQDLSGIKKNLDSAFLSKLTLLISENSEQAKSQLIELKYSRNEIRALSKVIHYLEVFEKKAAQLSLREQYFLFLDLKDIFPVFAISGLALGIAEETIKTLFQHYINPNDLLAHPQALISGHDLIKHFRLKPSPIIGELLTEIQLAQIEGKINTYQDALRFVEDLHKS